MKSLFLVSLCCLSCLATKGQIAKTKFVYQFDISEYTDTIITNQQSNVLLKFINKNRNNFDDLGFAYLIDRLLEEKKITVYKNEICTQIFDKLEFPFSTQGEKFDTLFQKAMQNEALTKEETSLSIQVKPPHFQILFPNQNSVFQLNQIWKFDNSTRQLSNSIATINLGYFDNQNFKRLGTIKNNPSTVESVQSELGKSSVIWAKRIHAILSFSKSNSDDSLQQKIINETHFSSHKIVDNQGKTITNETAINNYFNGFDTISSVNFETFELADKIVRHCYNPADNNKYQIVQDFYFDATTNSINTKVLAIAPLRDYYDDFGNFKFTRLMFWLVYDDDFLKSLD